MKLSELIKLAQLLLKEHGDLTLTCYTGSQNVTNVKRIGVKFRNKTRSAIFQSIYWHEDMPEKQKGEAVVGVE